jgi:hypothetical protein
MDYGSIEAEWTGEILATPMVRDDIEGVLEAISLFGDELYPEGLRESLTTSLALEQREGPGTLRATLIEGPSAVAVHDRVIP